MEMETMANIVVTKNRVIVGSQQQNQSYSEVLRFRLDPIHNHPIFGSAAELEGEIPFLAPVSPMQSHLDSLHANPTLITTIAKGIVSKYRNAWANETDEEIFDYLRVRLVTAILCLGECECVRVDEKRTQMGAECLALACRLDDIIDDNGEDGIPDLGQVDYVQLMTSWAESEQPPFDAMPSCIADIERLKSVMKIVVQELAAVLGSNGWKKMYTLGHVRDDLRATLSATLLTHGTGKGEHGSRFSEETLSELRRDLCGLKLTMDAVAFFRGAIVCPEVRRDDLFRIAQNRATDIGLIMNAVLGLARDVREGYVDSPITCSVVHEGVPLQEAFDKAMRRLHAVCNDYRLAAGKLVEVWGEREPNIGVYVDVMNRVNDAMLLGYHLNFMDKCTDQTRTQTQVVKL